MRELGHEVLLARLQERQRRVQKSELEVSAGTEFVTNSSAHSVAATAERPSNKSSMRVAHSLFSVYFIMDFANKTSIRPHLCHVDHTQPYLYSFHSCSTYASAKKPRRSLLDHLQETIPCQQGAARGRS